MTGKSKTYFLIVKIILKIKPKASQSEYYEEIKSV